MIRGQRCKGDAKSESQQIRGFAIPPARQVLRRAAILAASDHSFYTAPFTGALTPNWMDIDGTEFA
jgi:hypothetical protein